MACLLGACYLLDARPFSSCYAAVRALATWPRAAPSLWSSVSRPTVRWMPIRVVDHEAKGLDTPTVGGEPPNSVCVCRVVCHCHHPPPPTDISHSRKIRPDLFGHYAAAKLHSPSGSRKGGRAPGYYTAAGHPPTVRTSARFSCPGSLGATPCAAPTACLDSFSVYGARWPRRCCHLEGFDV